MRFGEPLLLWGLVVVPLFAIAYAVFFARRRRLLERLGDPALVARMTTSVSPRRRRFKAYLSVLALGLGLVALARPQLGSRAKLEKQHGLDVVVALDCSRSMLARDVYPSRLERAKRELERLIEDLVGDRVGLVAFAGETISYPLTTDHAAIKLLFRNIGPKDVPAGGTGIGQALRASVEMLRRARTERRRAQIVVLVSDGEDTTGEPVAAARDAAKDGIRVFTIGVGSLQGELVPQMAADGSLAGYLRGPDGELVTTRLDEGRLRRVAEVTGGEYYRVDPRRFGVDAVRIALGNLQRAEHEARLVRKYEEGYAWFLFPAFMLLLAEAALGDRRRAQPGLSAAALVGLAPGGRDTGLALLRPAVILLALPLLVGFDLLKAPDRQTEEANRLLSDGRVPEALTRYEAALAALPNEPGAHFNRGVALYAAGRHEEAQREFLRAAEAKDAALKAAALYNMGNAFYRMGKYSEAAQAYTRSLAIDPRDVRAKWNLELALRNQRADEVRRADEQKRLEQEELAAAERRRLEEEERRRREAEEGGGPGQEKEAAGSEPERPLTLDDVEVILDAIEQNERTLQQELARRRAQSKKVERDW